MRRPKSENERVKLGEIVLLGPPGSERYSFLSCFCHDLAITESDLLIGRYDVFPEIQLYFYSIGSDATEFAWDLIAQKMLGYIVLFNWHDLSSFEKCKELLDFTTLHISTPLIIAADTGEKPFVTPESIKDHPISLARKSRFIFCKSNHPASVKKVVVALIDLLIETLP
jgi:hypothetical protein